MISEVKERKREREREYLFVCLRKGERIECERRMEGESKRDQVSVIMRQDSVS